MCMCECILCERVCMCVSHITESVSPLLAKLWSGKIPGHLTHFSQLWDQKSAIKRKIINLPTSVHEPD